MATGPGRTPGGVGTEIYGRCKKTFFFFFACLTVSTNCQFLEQISVTRGND